MWARLKYRRQPSRNGMELWHSFRTHKQFFARLKVKLKTFVYLLQASGAATIWQFLAVRWIYWDRGLRHEINNVRQLIMWAIPAVASNFGWAWPWSFFVAKDSKLSQSATYVSGNLCFLRTVQTRKPDLSTSANLSKIEEQTFIVALWLQSAFFVFPCESCKWICPKSLRHQREPQ